MGQLGNGTYTNGNKGSNFSFELSTLKALEQIAILIEAGGAVPGNQNLEQVTTLGNTTSQGLVVTPSVIVGQPDNDRTEVFINRIETKTKDGLYVLNTDTAPGKIQDIADADGVIVMSVNGQTANAQGNVVVPPPFTAGRVTIPAGQQDINVPFPGLTANTIILTSFYDLGAGASTFPTLVTYSLPGIEQFYIQLIGARDPLANYYVNYLIIN